MVYISLLYSLPGKLVSQSTLFWDSFIKKMFLGLLQDYFQSSEKKMILRIFTTVLIVFMEKWNFGCPYSVILEVLLINVLYIHSIWSFFEFKMNLMMILVPRTLQESWKATLGNSYPGTVFKIRNGSIKTPPFLLLLLLLYVHRCCSFHHWHHQC